jgi:hypothetical protein
MSDQTKPPLNFEWRKDAPLRAVCSMNVVLQIEVTRDEIASGVALEILAEAKQLELLQSIAAAITPDDIHAALERLHATMRSRLVLLN